MATGVQVRLYDDAGDEVASLSGITACWWDVATPTSADPVVRVTGLSTDADGWIKLDLSEITALAEDSETFLLLYKEDVSDYQDSLVFASKVLIADVTGGTVVSAWTRPHEWLEITAPSAATEKIVGLYAVYKNSAYIAFRCSGAYTVDWGDGTAPENVNSNTTALHLYDWSDGDLDDTNWPVTLTDTGDLVGRTAHGYTDGMTVRLWDIVSTTGVNEGQVYYVVNASTDTFQVSLTEGGSAVTLTTNGTAALLPYKQAIVEITPQAANNLTAVSFQYKHTASGLQAYAPGWLDLAISVPNCTALVIGGTTVYLSMLERGHIVAHNATNLASLFSQCHALQSVPLFDTSAVTNMDQMFYNCHRLVSAPALDTSSVTTMAYMFLNCYSLESVPLYDTSAVTTSMLQMFRECRSLRSIPLFDTAGVTSMSTMFNGCYSLQHVPLLDTGSVTNMSSMFQNCTSLQSVPEFDCSAVTTMQTMFSGCYSLQDVPALDCSAATSSSSYTQMFYGCRSLSRIRATGFKYTFTVADCKLSAAALDELYGNLATVTSQTITVSNNVGTAGDDPSIATAKGWTVTG